jgi:N-dimethylarginine dimethylaminohydrolase
MATMMMSPPDHFAVAYEINPFMHIAVAVDHERAVAQWEGLRDVVIGLGAEVRLQPPAPGLPDLVFTANAGLVLDGVAVPARFRHDERGGEEPLGRAWFAAQGLEVRELPGAHPFEGAGDAMPAGPDGVVLAGYRWRTSIAAHAPLARVLGRPVRSVALADPRFYHLDLALLPLGARRALAVGAAFDGYSRRVVAAVVPEVEELTLDEGLAFVANAVVVGDAVVLHRCPPRVGRVLAAWGYDAVEAPVDEFLKAGGSCRCLTLRLS